MHNPKIDTDSSLIRDLETNAVISNDRESYAMYLKQKQTNKNQKKLLEEHHKDIDYLKREIANISETILEIKNMIIKLLEKV